jgi:hypothetical protein
LRAKKGMTREKAQEWMIDNTVSFQFPVTKSGERIDKNNRSERGKRKPCLDERFISSAFTQLQVTLEKIKI